MIIFLIFALLIATLGVIFALQNTATATVNFLFWTFQGSLALVLLIALVAGALVSILVSMPALIRDKLTIRTQKKQVTELEARLSDHKRKLEDTQQKLQEKEQEQAAINDSEPPQEPA